MEQQQIQPCEEDSTMPQDIEKRFQHLLNEWLTFQKRAGFVGSGKEEMFSNLLQPSESSNKAHTNDNKICSIPMASSLPRSPESIDRKTLELDHCEQNTWNDLCKILSDEELSVTDKKLQENSDDCLINKEQLRLSEQKLLNEQDKLVDAQNSLLKYEESLSKREKLLQQQHQAVAEREREVALSLSEVQNRAAELVVEELSIQEKRQQLEVLEIQLEKTLQDMQVEKEILNKQRLSVQEQELQFLSKERSVESHLTQVKEESDKLKEEWEMLKQEQEKLKAEQAFQRKEKEVNKEKQERLTAKETMLKSIEKEIEGKYYAVESLAGKLNAREKLLKNIQKQIEEERIQINDIMTKLDAEKKVIEDAKGDLEMSRKSVDAARESLSKEHEEAALYIKTVDVKVKERENRLMQQEEEIQQKQEFLQGIEAQVKSEQQHCHMLHTKVQKEQEKIAADLTEQESNLRKREAILEKKDEEMKKSLQKLSEKRNLADMKLKQLKEIETRTEALENELHKRHQEHLQKVEWHAKDYQTQLEHLETVKHDLQQKSADIDRRFQEVRALKKEVKLWQKEAEKDLDVKADELLKEKADLELQKKNLKNLQYEVERAGAKVIDNMMNLDQASTKLDTLREKLDGSQQKMQMIAHHIIKQQKVLKERETSLGAKEHHIEALQKEWERRNVELLTKETTLSLKEQALKSKEENSNKESVLKTKLIKENELNGDSSLKIHYMITEEKLEVSKNRETPHEERVHNSSTEHEAKRSEDRKAEEQAEMLNLELFQQEFARIMKERERLKCQQHELEETKNEVQDAKLTLAAQLRATKDMVVGASITAQKASREREALEQERRRLGKAQKEIEAAFAAREAKLSMDEKKLEKECQLLEEEKERIMDLIHKAGQMRQPVGGMETSGIAENHLETSRKSVPGQTLSHPFNDQEPPELHPDPPMTMAHTNSRFDLDMINLWRENECAKIEREEKMIMDEISRLHSQHQDDMKQSGFRELSNILDIPCFPSTGAGKGSYHLFQCDLGPSLEALQLPRQGSYDVHPHEYYCPVSDEPSDGLFSGSEAAFSRDAKQHVEHMDQLQGNYDPYFQDVAPSQTRLENVMQSLVNARQASRSRLHRTKNLLQALPLSGGLVIAEVQQAICALTERLNLMEQMEDELADELREAYRIELPDSEGIIVDKVELLCKMEEQQTLRAEWEEDMQSQLEKISILQANSQASSCFSTPIKRTVFDHIVSPPSTNQSTR